MCSKIISNCFSYCVSKLCSKQEGIPPPLFLVFISHDNRDKSDERNKPEDTQNLLYFFLWTLVDLIKI